VFVEKQTILNLTSLVVNKLGFAMLIIVNSAVNKLSLTEINQFPNYLLVYYIQLIGPPLLCDIIIGFQIFRHKSIRKFIINDMIDCIN